MFVSKTKKLKHHKFCLQAAAKSIPSWAEELDDVSNEARQIVAEKRQAPLRYIMQLFCSCALIFSLSFEVFLS